MIFNIQQFIDHDYATDTRKDRRKCKGGTQEFFTPFSIVQKMCNMIGIKYNKSEINKILNRYEE